MRGDLQAIRNGTTRENSMSMLKNKVSIVTGSGQGIGQAIALSYAAEGSKVVVTDINAEAGEATVKLIKEAGGEAAFVLGDVSQEDSVKAAIEFVISTYGQLDIACNSAALSRGSGPIHLFEKAVFDETLSMCLTNTWLCMKYQIAAMLESGGGAIVNISSNASLKGQANNTAYAAAKSGVNLLTMSSAAEYGDKGIRINAVSPGVIHTPGLEKYFEEQPKIAEGLKRKAVMNRLGEPEEIAEAVTFLSSDRASFITGQLLSVDGGAAVK